MSHNPLQPPQAYGFKTIPPFALANLDADPETCLSPNPSHANPPVPFIISMAPIDRAILESLDSRWNLLKNLEKRDDHDLLLQHMFYNWDWTYTISSFIVNVLKEPIGSPELVTQEERYHEALHYSGSFKGSAVEEFRSKIIQRDNRDFLHQLGEEPISKIKFVPSEHDGKHWDMLAAMFLRFPNEMLFWMNAPARRRVFQRRNAPLEWLCAHFSIRVVCRIFDLRCRRPSNSNTIQELFSGSPSSKSLLFSLQYRGSQSQEFLHYMDQPLPSAASATPEITEDAEESPIGSEVSNTNLSIPLTVQQGRGKSPHQKRDNELEDQIQPSTEDSENVNEEYYETQTSQEEEDIHLNVLKVVLAKKVGDLVDANDLSFESLWEALLGTERWHYAQFLGSFINPRILRGGNIPLETNLDVDLEEQTLPNEVPDPQAPVNTTVADDLVFEPGAYLEVIPWSELDRLPTNALPENIQRGFNLSTTNDSAGFCYYDPSPASPMDYHIVSEEEVLQYRHEHKLYSFGHVVDAKVLFRMRPIGKVFFCSNFQEYWHLWNDCALTVDPGDGAVFLLSTLPGERYRDTYASFDNVAALTLHRREVDNHASSEVTSTVFKRILGPIHTELHDSLLRYIPASELVDLGQGDIGRGSFGAVSVATWRRKQSFEHKTSFDVPVVLKRLQGLSSRAPSSDLFPKELQISYLSLTGLCTNCTQLYGITELPWSTFPGTLKDGTCFCFVFERATEGHLLPYLDSLIRKSAWGEVAEILAGVFGGLNTLHERDILHCDLHPGNILLTTPIVTRLGVPTESELSELSVRLCDFGQSRLVTETSPGSFSNQKAATRYRAPELSAKGAVHTKATDVFAAGVFTFDVLSLVAKGGTGLKDPILVPGKLWKLSQQCTLREPGDRPKAIEAVFELEKLKDHEYGKKQNFELIDLREALRRTHSSDMNASPVGSAEDIDSLLSYQSLQDSLDRFF